MPGRGSYGPGGRWIHDRAHRLLPQMRKQYGSEREATSVAFATATQQAHKVGKSPKGFRTPEGVREAKMKHGRPREEYRKTAGIHPAARTALFDELAKIAAASSFALKPGTIQASQFTPPKMPRGLSGTAPGPSNIVGKQPNTPSVGEATKRLAPPVAT